MSNNSNQDDLGGGALPFFAFVLAIVAPPVGAVLGHVAMSQMKNGQISSSNRGMALASVILGWTFTALALLIVPILLSLFVLIGFTGS